MSVRRVNLIGHGNPGLLGLTGTLDFREEQGGVRLGEALSIDHLNNQGFGRVTARWLNEDEEGIPFRDRIRRVLTDDAEFALILCHSGDVEGQFLMRTMADVFRTVMLGFQASIVYHPALNAQRTRIVDRRMTSVGFEGGTGAGYKCKTERAEPFAGKHLEYEVSEVSDAQVGIAAGRAAHREAARAGK